MTDEDEDTPKSVRDFRLMMRTAAVVAVVASTLIGSVIYAAVAWTRLVTRVEALEDRQKQKDREAARELWRRDRSAPLGPGIERPRS